MTEHCSPWDARWGGSVPPPPAALAPFPPRATGVFLPCGAVADRYPSAGHPLLSLVTIPGLAAPAAALIRLCLMAGCSRRLRGRRGHRPRQRQHALSTGANPPLQTRGIVLLCPFPAQKPPSQQSCSHAPAAASPVPAGAAGPPSAPPAEDELPPAQPSPRVPLLQLVAHRSRCEPGEYFEGSVKPKKPPLLKSYWKLNS